MNTNSEPRHWIIDSHTGPRAISRQTRKALETLGYKIILGDSTPAGSQEIQKPALRLIDERHLAGAPSPSEDPDTPIVLLTGNRPKACEDRRVVDRLRRPARLQDLFRSFQSALEVHPRRAPRVATQLPARCVRFDHRWPGAVLSLSEGGCLIRTSEKLDPGARMNLQFAIPKDGIIATRAECVYQRESEMGLAFSETSEQNRLAIGGFVETRLAGL